MFQPPCLLLCVASRLLLDSGDIRVVFFQVGAVTLRDLVHAGYTTSPFWMSQITDVLFGTLGQAVAW